MGLGGGTMWRKGRGGNEILRLSPGIRLAVLYQDRSIVHSLSNSDVIDTRTRYR